MAKALLNDKPIKISEREYQALLRNDLYLFIQRSFYELNPQTKYLPNWHIEEIAQTLEDCRLGTTKRLIINVPPRSLKSHCASIAFPAWLLGHNPSSQIICVSYGQDLSDTLAGNCRTLMSSAWYQKLFPTRLAMKKQSVNDFYTMKNGFRMATSVGGVLTGRGGDFLIIDDPLKPEEAASETQRKAVNDWYDHTLITRLNDKRDGCIIIIMQRLHEDDLVGHVTQRGEWKVLRFPAIAEEEENHVIRSFGKTRVITRKVGEALHPEREPIEKLNEIRELQGEYNFAGQYQQAPAPLAGGMVKRQWFITYGPEGLPQKFDLIFQSWDTANKAGEINDYSVCTTWGVAEKNHLYLLHVFRARLEYPELRRVVLQLAERHQAKTVVIEDKASGTQLIQDLRRAGFDRVTSFEGAGDKQMRMNTVTPKIEGGFVHIPQQAEWLETYLFELTVFPNGRYDDQVDSTSQALAWIRDNCDKNRYGLLEVYQQLQAAMDAPRITGPHMCTKCNKEMTQRLPGGLRCAHCGEQWAPTEPGLFPPPFDFLNDSGRRSMMSTSRLRIMSFPSRLTRK
jgi:predicted phage terminase large subunit-like protein